MSRLKARECKTTGCRKPRWSGGLCQSCGNRAKLAAGEPVGLRGKRTGTGRGVTPKQPKSAQNGLKRAKRLNPQSEFGKVRKAAERSAMTEYWNKELEGKPQNRCAECGCGIGRKFAAVHVAHIWSKGSAPAFRCDLRNFILLCFACHREYDHGRWPERMKIWGHCQDVILELKNEGCP